MALPTDYQPLIDRIYEVLTGDAGAARRLALTNATRSKFRKVMWPDAPDDVIAREALVGPLCYASMVGGVDGEQTQEFSDRAMYLRDVRIDLGYHVDNPILLDRVSTITNTAAGDAHKVRAALAWPPNMVTTQDGRATGLEGSGLVYQSDGPPTINTTTRVLRYPVLFKANLWLAYPA